jgi:uncharacterized protein (DUF1330 family)
LGQGRGTRHEAGVRCGAGPADARRPERGAASCRRHPAHNRTGRARYDVRRVRDAIRCRLMEMNLCVLLWAHEGRDAELSAYEDQVLGLLGEHDGHVVQRARTVGGNGDNDKPTEVQFLRFASEAALEGFMNDARRAALADQRDAAIAMTEVMRIQLV